MATMVQSWDTEYVLQGEEASLGHRNKISCFRPLGLVPVQFARPPTGALQSDPNSPAPQLFRNGDATPGTAFGFVRRAREPSPEANTINSILRIPETLPIAFNSSLQTKLVLFKHQQRSDLELRIIIQTQACSNDAHIFLNLIFLN